MEIEEEMLLRKKQQADPKAQKRLLIMVVSFVLILVIAIGAVFMYSNMKEQDNIHHNVEAYEEEADE